VNRRIDIRIVKLTHYRRLADYLIHWPSRARVWGLSKSTLTGCSSTSSFQSGPPLPRRRQDLSSCAARSCSPVVRTRLTGWSAVAMRGSSSATVPAMSGPMAHDRRCRHRLIDLLLTDVVMPTLGGGRLAQEVDDISPHMKVLYTSGYTDDAIVRQGVLQDGVAFIAKPFTPVALAEKVREVLDAGSVP
jgi:CheY-like chemotaxis protein